MAILKRTKRHLRGGGSEYAIRCGGRKIGTALVYPTPHRPHGHGHCVQLWLNGRPESEDLVECGFASKEDALQFARAQASAEECG